MVNKVKNFYRDNQFLRVLMLFIVILLPWVFAIILLRYELQPITEKSLLEQFSSEQERPVYHTKFEELQKPFNSAKEVTAECLKCHTERHREIMKSTHWNWEKEDLKDGITSVYIGKRTALNNFCIGVQSNEQTCTRCHIGYGYGDKTFDFKDPNAIDCLVCHDNTSTYKKAKGQAGWPAAGEKAPDYNHIAQHVSSPQRENCGKCHFWGGGGNNVKHGDLEKALIKCTKEIDVHMAYDGSDMSCIECHTTENHNITGRNYSNTYSNTNRVTCEQCHQNNPHSDDLINKHTVKISCQACHIPKYAKENATKMYWDWSTAGKLNENGEPYHEEDDYGNHTYLSIKGSFKWERDVTPEYVWFNGTADHYILGDKIDTIPLQMNTLNGEYSCANSKIIPVKVHRGKQPYDPENNYLVQLKTFGENKGEGAFWKDFEWISATEKGMEYVGLPFSGKIDFIETEMYMPINHMVAEKEKTVSCIECHSRDGRLAKLSGFYLPGRDRISWLDNIGIALIVLALISVLVHGVMRIFSANKLKTSKK